MDILLGKAFKTIPGGGYNRYREEIAEGPASPAIFYEVPLMETRPWAYLRDRIYPSFVRYLQAKRLDAQSGEGVVVAVFHGHRCHLLKGEAFIQIFRQMEDLDDSGFRSRVKQWLSG
jgi:hypothetical protein